ncbi:MAG: YdcF family protein [Acidimicrobiales bacterium]
MASAGSSDDPSEGGDGPEASDAGPAAPRRWLPPLIVATAIIAVLVGIYGYWVGWARPDVYTSADAVVVHAGQRHRLRLARTLMDEGVAPVLVVFDVDPSDGLPDICADSRDYQVVCAVPAGDSTIGEASVIASLADERAWSSVVIVTSDYHLRRARYLDRKCVAPTVAVFGEAAVPKDLTTRFRGVVQEMAAIPVAVFQRCTQG